MKFSAGYVEEGLDPEEQLPQNPDAVELGTLYLHLQVHKDQFPNPTDKGTTAKIDCLFNSDYGEVFDFHAKALSIGRTASGQLYLTLTLDEEPLATETFLLYG